MIEEINANESAQPQDDTREDEPDAACTVVGIGASAGGLPALQRFFATLAPDSGMAFVVIMHLAPERESHLATLLQRHTAMPVIQVTEKTLVEPNRVYVIPPNCNLADTGTHLQLIPLEEERQARAPVDFFFRTLAEQRGDGVAIILSGSGADGALGIKAIKEYGGLLMVQDPVDAEYDGMPQSAIATGLVDVILPVEELARELLTYQQNRKIIKLPDEPAALPDEDQDALHQILVQIQLRTGHDFSQYKRSTVLRRIGRRMQVTHSTALKTYLNLLRRSPAEVALLFQDLLISVTSFFRDRETFGILEGEIIPQLFANKGAGDTVRVWVVGCATGEEAYSLAFLLLEQAARLGYAPEIQIFATDLDEQALRIARQGIYPAAIVADIAEERLGRFFTQEDDHVRVKAGVRERVLFALHNVIKDPPFSRLDLISCRNLLIYLQHELQERVFGVFHYALRPQGYLLLGSAESAESATELFVTLDKKHRVYQRREGASAQPILASLPAAPVNAPRPASAGVLPLLTRRSGAALHYQVLEELAPPSLLVDEQLMVLHLSETVGRYLVPPGGSLTGDITRLVRPELQAGLRSALYQAFGHGRATVTPPVPVQFNGSPHLVSMAVRPRQQAGDRRLALVTFLEDESGRLEDGLDSAEVRERDATIRRLAEKLRHEHEQLQAMQEEHETSEEELRASNEELQSTNEEYKSTLEELETSKEELQSINEELQTVNQELKNKVEEVTQAHSDLQNLLATTDIATLFLDRDLIIKWYTPRVPELFHLVSSDQGRPIGQLKPKISYAALEADAQRVLQGQELVECEAPSEDGRWFLVRQRPYRTADGHIDGVVITFFDLTERRQAEQRKVRLLHEVERQRTLLRTLNRTLARAQEHERQELARNLHDLIGQNLTALSLSLKLIQTQLAASELAANPVDATLQEARRLAEQLTEQVRDVMSDLRPPMLADYGLLAALRWYATQFARRTGLTVDVQGEQSFPRLPEEVELTLFRIAQEAFNNVAKHAQATHVTVTLVAEDRYIRLSVADNGRGMVLAGSADPEQLQGWGVLIMRERAESVGGRFELQSGPGQGVTIAVEVER